MQIAITKKAKKELDKLPIQIIRKISKEILELKKNPYPSNSKKLKSQENYRIRIGVYRAIYMIDKKNKEITILRIAHRREVYKY